MGYNRVILTLNDFDHDPKAFRDHCNEAFARLQRKRWEADRPKQPERYLAVEAVWEDHADNTVLILAGGNTATVLGSVHNGGRHHTEEEQVKILKEVIDRMGYRLVRKSNRRANSSTKTS